MSRLMAIRAAWGAALLIFPGAVLRCLTHQQIDRSARAVARILGVRHLGQAAIVGPRPSRGSILAGAAVDAAHASSMALLAAFDRDQRRLASTSAGIAATFALAGLRQARTSSGPASPPPAIDSVTGFGGVLDCGDHYPTANEMGAKA